jgi:hypothetical protein
MIKVYVDISLFTKDNAFGRISGSIEVPELPQIGDLISFPLSAAEEHGGYVGLLRVSHRIIPANRDEQIQLSLEDVTVETMDDARRVMVFFEEVCSLFGEPYGDEE